MTVKQRDQEQDYSSKCLYAINNQNTLAVGQSPHLLKTTKGCIPSSCIDLFPKVRAYYPIASLHDSAPYIGPFPGVTRSRLKPAIAFRIRVDTTEFYRAARKVGVFRWGTAVETSTSQHAILQGIHEDASYIVARIIKVTYNIESGASQ